MIAFESQVFPQYLEMHDRISFHMSGMLKCGLPTAYTISFVVHYCLITVHPPDLAVVLYLNSVFTSLSSEILYSMLSA